MDAFETPYEEEAEFIQCTVCDKSIKGESLYKIHLTAPGHIKKEDSLVAAGLAVRQQTIPIFEDIIQYLDYMKLDEPIIGLSYLEETPSDPQTGPKYMCKLCHQTANLLETVRHVIGRKHRQKYVELKRPDLVTWDKQSIINQGGKIIRARAEIIERQDGRGTPVSLPKKRNMGQFNTLRAFPRQNQNNGRNTQQRGAQRDMPSHRPRFMDNQDDCYQGRFPPEHLNTPLSHPEDPFMESMDRQRADYRDSDVFRREYSDPDYRRRYEGDHVGDPQRRVACGPGGGPRYESREDLAEPKDYYPDEAPPYRRPYPERDLLKDLYSEEMRRQQAGSTERQSLHMGGEEEENRRWSLHQDSVNHEGMNRPGRQGPSESEAQRRSFPSQMEVERLQDSLFNLTRDYSGEMRKPHHEEAGSSRTGPPQLQRRAEVSKTMSDIPEPFRRFLEGPSNEEQQSVKRKRKSRFSDATAEEVESTKELFNDDFGPPNPKFGYRPGPVSVPLRPEAHERPRPNLYIQSQSTHHTERDHTEGSDSGGVFDLLKNIEIDNAEEAIFLKSRLCELLKEFKTKKTQKVAGNSHGRAVTTKDFDSFQLEPELVQHRYEPGTKQDSDHRRPQELYYQEDYRGRGREYEKLLLNECLQEFSHPVHGEHRQLSRGHYEGDFGWQDSSRPPHGSHAQESPRYSDRFQEPRHPGDYRPAAAEFLDSHSPAPPLHYERGPRMDRGSRYTNNLEKITSTLLELVARK